MPGNNSSTRVSIIIPAYNEAKVIERNLRSLKDQTYKNIEIIVVDDASNDKTAVIAEKYTDKVYRRKHQERSIQRNYGASKSEGNFLMFLDADMELEKNVISECVEVMQNKEVGAVSIPEVSVANTYWEKVKAFERSFYNLEGDTAIDAARFFRRSAFDKVGGYDESITGPEDWDLPERIAKAGFKTGRTRSKIKHYERVPNPFKLAKKKYYYGLRAYRYFEKHGISPVGAKTIYFLRPVFYKNWKKLIGNPILTLSMFFMLTLEQIAGGMGYIVGKYRKL